MPSANSQSTEIKFSEWRPIGVCDNGPPNHMKAKIFTQDDLAIATAPGIDRRNWRKHPELLKLIHRYAKEVAAMSSVTEGMIRPAVRDIKLVGMVLQYGKTPRLNQESEAGKVQLFQVEFFDKGKRRSWFWKIISALLLTLLLMLTGILIAEWMNQKSQSRNTVTLCGAKRSDPTYAQHLIQTESRLKTYTYPFSRQIKCRFDSNSIPQQEQNIVRCYLDIQKTLAPSIHSTADPLYNVQQCIARICQKDLSALRSYCRALRLD